MQTILARDLTKTYSFYEKEAGLSGSISALFRGKKTAVEAVRGIDLDVRAGEVVGFIGPNGAGKTTTLKMLSGVLHLVQMNGLKKRVKVAFSGPCNTELVKTFGKAVQLNDREVLLEVEPEQAATVASSIFHLFQVSDIQITDPHLRK